MAGKARVHELAKELGVESKTVLAKLKEMGEFVKSASSTVEAPVARRLKEAFPTGGNGAAAPAGHAAARTAPAGTRAASPGAVVAPAVTPSPAPTTGAGTPRPAAPAPGAPAAPTPRPGVPGPGRPAAPASPSPAGIAPAAGGTAAPPAGAPGGTAPTPGATSPAPPARPAPGPAAPPPGPRPAAPRPATPAAGVPGTPGPTLPPRPAPRPGPRPAPVQRPAAEATPTLPPRPAPARPGPGTARPGNNPFMSPGSSTPQMPPRPGPGGPGRAPGIPRPMPGAGGARPGGPRPGGPRPSPGMMPPRPMGGRPAAGARPGAAPGRGPARPGAGARPGAPAGAGAGGAGRPGFGGRPGGPGARGRGGTAGAFGPGGRGRGAKQRKSKRAKRAEFDNLQAPTMESGAPRGNGETVRLPRGASLSDFADKINANPGSLVQVLFGLGEMVTATQSCTDDTLELLGVQLGYDVQIVSPEDEDREILEGFGLEFGGEYDEDAELVSRPPVVTIMGHVDHGKTKLLDAIRSTKVAEGESGGITQHIGAYQVAARVSDSDQDRAITFIDTPGHESFTAMRARGAQVTDIVVLVVAADDGVKPQTIEALNHAKAADVPIVVAVNKVDKEGADPAKVRGQLTEYGLVAEDYGGDTIFVDLSAKTGQGIDDLLESILLTADAALTLEADATVDAQGVAIEAHLDKGRGPVATVLIQRGTLRVGDSVVAGDAFGRVRAMLDENGRPLDEAGPSRPVQVLGFTSVPGAGDNFLVVSEDRIARQVAEQRQARERNAALAASRGKVSLEDIFERMEKGKIDQLNLILKGDVAGSVEALEDALLKIDVGDEVSLRIIDRGVGAITETNVMLASASEAIILGFNVRPQGKATELADREGVDIRYYSVIYQALEDIENALRGMLKPEFEEVQLGTAEVREVFRVPRIGNVAGCIVRTGTITRNSKARLVRDGVVVQDNLTVESLRRFKEDVTEVRDGFECGIGLGSFNDIKLEDVIETFESREKPRA